ncbi:hypothetical protein GJV52_06715 [Neisseria brasiliensis]|nr:hypothetical protein GJV52_06715 [Neisseria brasiliensis]
MIEAAVVALNGNGVDFLCCCLSLVYMGEIKTSMSLMVYRSQNINILMISAEDLAKYHKKASFGLKNIRPNEAFHQPIESGSVRF